MKPNSLQAEGVGDRQGGDVPVQAPQGAEGEQGAGRQDHQPVGAADLQPVDGLQDDLEGGAHGHGRADGVGLGQRPQGKVSLLEKGEVFDISHSHQASDRWTAKVE